MVLLVGAGGWILALAVLLGAAPEAGAAEVRGTSMRIAYPVDGAWRHVDVHMLVYVDGTEPFEDVANAAREAMLKRFEGGVELRPEVSAQYALIGIRWPENRAAWAYNPDGKPAHLSGTADVLIEAATTWNHAGGADFRFDGGALTEAEPGMCDGEADGKNTVGWGHAGASILAVTCLSDTEEMTEFDIIFDIRRAWTRSESDVEIDLQSVAVHEFGHALGLDHSSERAAVMFGSYPAGLLKRELHKDDIAGLIAIYGLAEGEATPSPASTPTPAATLVVPGLQRD
jgi:predicted Zn-dependent protease